MSFKLHCLLKQRNTNYLIITLQVSSKFINLGYKYSLYTTLLFVYSFWLKNEKFFFVEVLL